MLSRAPGAAVRPALPRESAGCRPRSTTLWSRRTCTLLGDQTTDVQAARTIGAASIGYANKPPPLDPRQARSLVATGGGRPTHGAAGNWVSSRRAWLVELLRVAWMEGDRTWQ